MRYFPHFIATQGYISLLAWCDILPISFLSRAIFHCLPTLVFHTFHCYPGVYFIACLVQYFTYFIPIQGYISLLVYFAVLPISLLPRHIFHCYPGPYFIACLVRYFYPFHCYPGLYFIACLHCCFSYFISTQAYISLLA